MLKYRKKWKLHSSEFYTKELLAKIGITFSATSDTHGQILPSRNSTEHYKVNMNHFHRLSHQLYSKNQNFKTTGPQFKLNNTSSLYPYSQKLNFKV